ncbi:MAG: hypothetical protein H7174_03725 [Flavobacterium sp.]|nr:hypothetical protein [Flavobacterium sp.]
MKKITFFLLTFLIKLTLNAQTAGTLDPNFGIAGTASITNEKYLIPYSIDFEAYSGEIATGGTYRTSTGKDVGFVERFDFYGNQRASFGTNGKLEISDLSTTSQQVNEVLFTNNSGFIVRGTYKDAANTTVLFLRKYLANGTVDSSFGSGGILTGIYGEIQSSYIYYIKINPVTLHQYLSRYNLADGTLDTTFNSSDFPFLNTDNYYYSSQYRHINFQADGKIILCGYKTINTVKYPFLGRYDGLGNLDTTFGNNGYYVGANGGVAFQSKTQSDGKIIFIDGYADAGVNKVLNRLNANGTVDTSYGTLGSFTYNFNFSGNFIDKIIMQSDDKILFCGTETMNTNGSLSSLYSARVNTSGVLDFWRQDLQSSYSENYSMAKLNDAFVLTYGLSSNANYTLSNSIIQRIYLKAPLISLIGDAYPNGNFVNDLDMSTINGTVYTLNNITLTSGKEVKFRIEHDWKLN